jgi:hypothetical protein
VIPISFAAGLLAGWVAHAVKGQALIHHEQYERERDLVEPILRADPAFSGVKMSQSSSGDIYFVGMTSLNPADRSRLRELIAHELGKPRADELVGK